VFAPAEKQGPSVHAKGKVGRTPALDHLAFELDVRMKAPPRSSPAIKSLTGEWHIVGAEKMVTVAFNDLTKPVQKKNVGDGTITLKSVKTSGHLMFVEIDLAYPDDGPQFESFEAATWLKHNQIFLENKKNPKLKPDMEVLKSVERNTSNEATIKYIFKGA